MFCSSSLSAGDRNHPDIWVEGRASSPGQQGMLSVAKIVPGAETKANARESKTCQWQAAGRDTCHMLPPAGKRSMLVVGYTDSAVLAWLACGPGMPLWLTMQQVEMKLLEFNTKSF